MGPAGDEARIGFFGGKRIIATHGENRDVRIPHIRSDASGETVHRIFAGMTASIDCGCAAKRAAIANGRAEAAIASVASWPASSFS